MLVVPGLAEPGFAFVPVDDFMFAPVVVDELVEVAALCLVCLYVFADAAKGDPARPAITSAVIVSLLFIMTWNSLIASPEGKTCCPRCGSGAMRNVSCIAMRAERPRNPRGQWIQDRPVHTECSRR